MTAVATELYRWFNMKASNVGEAEHVYFRHLWSRNHGVTVLINRELCFVFPNPDGTIVAVQLTTAKDGGGTMCRAAYGITDPLPRVHGVASRVLRDSPENITRRAVASLGQVVNTDDATWALSICIAADGAHFCAGGHHGVVFCVNDEYCVFTVRDKCIVRFPLWQFLSSCATNKLECVAALKPGDRDAALAFCESAVGKGKNWSLVEYNERNFCGGVADGSIIASAASGGSLSAARLAAVNRSEVLPIARFFSNVLNHRSVAEALSRQEWNVWGDPDDAMRVTGDVTQDEVLSDFIKSRFRSDLFNAAHVITQSILLQHNGAATQAFVSLHSSESRAREKNPLCRVIAPLALNSDKRNAIDKLKSLFEEKIADGAPQPAARIVLAWHGVSHERVRDLCRDGPRNFGSTDPGFFGAGSYFAIEANYAAHYSRANGNGEKAMVLFAISVSQAYPVTVEDDYRTEAEEANTDRRTHGFSKFYSLDTSIAITRLYDAHFIPVKYYGKLHPRSGKPLLQDVDFQAAPCAQAQYHELLISSHHRCLPLAVVYFKDR